MSRSHRIALLVAGVAVTAGAQAAAADIRVHIGGSAHVRIGGGPVRAHWVRPWQVYRPHRPVIRIGGSIWLGGGYYPGPFAQPPPPPPQVESCNCDTPTYYPPIAPAPVAYASGPVVVADDPLPRFAIGAFLGGVDVAGQQEGKDVGVIGQFRLSRGLIAEAEIAKNELADGVRTDRRFMAGLQYELSPRRNLSPYVAAAIGATQVQVGEDWQDNQSLAEVGGGLRLRLSERITLFGDIRFGQRQTMETKDRPLPSGTDVGSTARAIPGDEERYSRARFGGLVTF